MLASIGFRFGSHPGEAALTIPLRPSVTVFVGPNNAGKSQTLREISGACRSGDLNGARIVESLPFVPLSEAEAVAYIDRVRSPWRPDEHLPVEHFAANFSGGRVHLAEPKVKRILQNPEGHRPAFAQWYVNEHMLNLDGVSRTSLVASQHCGDLKEPTTPFARLFTDNDKRGRLRTLIHEATGLFLVIDATVGGQLQIRYSRVPPQNERSLDQDNVEYMRGAIGIDEVSDGVKAYSGIILQLHVGNPNVIIIDEPEAFLHPTLAHNLGIEIARSAVTEGKIVFASTHSPQFLMGAISSGADVNIVRLTYSADVGTARLLDNDGLRALMTNPLLRSTGILEALFYDYVIVGEADADRAFYGEINQRLLDARDTRGIRGALFLNANGKDTVPSIVGPLRKLGIPAISVLDLDVLKEGGASWSRQLAAIGIPAGERDAYGTRRAAVLKSLEAAAKSNFKIEGGIELLKGEDRETAINLLRDLAGYGLFIVPSGEVESWLPALAVQRSKSGWLKNVFESMGSDPTARDYVRPQAGDVWDFVGDMKGWLSNAERRGIPR